MDAGAIHDTDEIERALRELHAAGRYDEAATQLVDAYGPELLGFLSAVLRDPIEAEEIYAIGSLDLWRGLSSFRGESSFRTWAYRIHRHAMSRELRRPERRRRGSFAEARTTALRAKERTATRPELRTDIKDAIRALRDELSEDERALLVLRVDRGLSWNEVAEVLDSDRSEAPTPRATALRKQFERTTKRLRALALARGLLGARDT